MIVFPAIDLIAGNVVRLRQGVRSAMDVYATDPVAVAKGFADAGATWVHIVDLSAAFGEDAAACRANAQAIQAICMLGSLKVDVGGGVRSMADVNRLVTLGASRIAIGTALVRDPSFAREAVATYGSLITADVAAKGDEVRVNGWRDGVPVALDGLLGRLTADGYRHLVFTDIARDGMQTGVNVATYRRVAARTGFPVVASGGVATLDDVRNLATQGNNVIEGVIIGRALYEHAFTLGEALAEAAKGHVGGDGD